MLRIEILAVVNGDTPGEQGVMLLGLYVPYLLDTGVGDGFNRYWG